MTHKAVFPRLDTEFRKDTGFYILNGMARRRSNKSNTVGPNFKRVNKFTVNFFYKCNLSVHKKNQSLNDRHCKMPLPGTRNRTNAITTEECIAYKLMFTKSFL